MSAHEGHLETCKYCGEKIQVRYAPKGVGMRQISKCVNPDCPGKKGKAKVQRRLK